VRAEHPVEALERAARGLDELGDAASPRATEPPAASFAVAEGDHKQATVLFCQLADSALLAERLGQEEMRS
jgi:hypothetical protein